MRPPSGFRHDDPKTKRPPSEFQYDALPFPNSIRLVQITTVTPYSIDCQLMTVQLGDHPSYETLSWCWGTSTKTVIVKCNDAILKISSSLWECLKYLHSHGKKAGIEWFWIDQICIDQKNDIERTTQVRLMRQIYQQSNRTAIWLPLENKMAAAVATIVHEIEEYVLEMTRRMQEEMESHEAVKTAETNGINSTKLKLPEQHDSRWDALFQLLELPWFERCWIIQEVALSGATPVMLVGDQELNWLDFCMTTRWLGVSYEQTRWAGNTQAVQNLGWVTASYGNAVSPEAGCLDLQTLLCLTNMTRATDARDQIFALLGLAKDTAFSSSWPIQLEPDYTRSIPSVFTEVTRYCMQTSKSLDLLRLVDHIDVPSGNEWPSWVPRWDLGIPAFRRAICSSTICQKMDDGSIFLTSINNASGDRNVHIDDSTASSVLRMSGVNLNVKLTCLPVIPDAELYHIAGKQQQLKRGSGKKVCAMLDTCKQHLPQLSEPELRMAFLTVTTLGELSVPEDVLRDALWQFDAYVRQHQSPQPHHDASQHSLISALGKTLSPSALMPLPSRFGETYGGLGTDRYMTRLGSLKGRRLFVTNSGLLGMGPAIMADGDSVVILFGGKVPYVLRLMGEGRWRFIGECYIHGIMNGEALQGRDADEHEWFEIV